MPDSSPSGVVPLAPTPRRIISPRPRRDLTWLWILLLMGLSAALRLPALGQTPLWGDEAAVYWRTCGTYQQFVEILRNDGFVPLHYTFYWVLRHFVPLTPTVLRLMPAVSSVLMVPAMYFLARQLVARPTALAAAAFAAVSGLVSWHARDAKMYSHFWLLCTLNMGCLLWWQQRGHGVAWWSWVTTGVTMLGLHSLGWGIIAIQPLVMFSRRPTLRTTALYLVGAAIIVAGPIYYYLNFNRWTRNIQDRGWQASGIAWIEQIMGNATPPDLVSMTASNFLFGYAFPPPSTDGVPPWWSWQYVPIIPAALGLVLCVGLFPWPTRRRGRPEMRDVPTAWWRSYLVLTAWAVLPPYAFYCASFSNYAWPTDLVWAGTRQPITAILMAGLVLAVAFYCCSPTAAGRLRRLSGFLGVSLVLMILACGIAFALSKRPPGPLWVTRYIAFTWPAFTIGLFALIGRLPIPPVRWLLVTVLLLLNALQSLSMLVWREEPPTDLLARDIIACRSQPSEVQTHFMRRSAQSLLSPIEGRYYLFLYSHESTYPYDFTSCNIARRFGVSNVTATKAIVDLPRTTPTLNHLIIWEQLPPSPVPRTDCPDPLAGRLPPEWHCTAHTLYPYASRWGWMNAGTWSRREYRRDSAR